MSTPFRKTLIIAASVGAGAVAMLAVIAGVIQWYSSRPKPWNTTAIVSVAAPGFSSSTDGKTVGFSYSVKNTTNVDYHVDSNNQVQVMAKLKDGTFVGPIPASLRLPIFVPAKQKGILILSMEFQGIPERSASETAAQFHERLRAYLKDHVGRLGSFVVFDNMKHYEISLPKWLSQPPKSAP